MIKITFMIGNGFDINAGFDTRYADFIRYYLDTESKTKVIEEFKKTIEQNRECWADAELAFGKMTERYSDVNAFLACYQDFCLQLVTYLQEQETRAVYARKDIRMKISQALLFFSDQLTASQKSRIKQLVYSVGGTYYFHFINFNYTRIFDRCLNSFRIPDKMVFNYRINDDIYSLKMEDVIHIHGDLSEPLLLGVNDEEQIANGEFLKNRKVVRQFIKPVTNAALQTMRDEEIQGIISDSNVICIYGMSIGATDRVWWKKIVAWLKQSDTRYLIIFTLAQNYHRNLSGSFLDTEEDVQNCLLSYVQLTEQEQNKLRSRIFVAINRPLFDFVLTGQTEEEAEEKQSA